MMPPAMSSVRYPVVNVIAVMASSEDEPEDEQPYDEQHCMSTESGKLGRDDERDRCGNTEHHRRDLTPLTAERDRIGCDDEPRDDPSEYEREDEPHTRIRAC